jgi:transposase-like protein
MMRKKSSAQKTIRDIRRVTRRHYSAEEKIRIVLEGLRGEDSTAEYFDMTEKALRAIEERQPKVFTAYRKGKARAIANAGSALMPGIKRGDNKSDSVLS